MSHNMHGEVRGHLEVFWWFLPLGRGDWIQLVSCVANTFMGCLVGLCVLIIMIRI